LAASSSVYQLVSSFICVGLSGVVVEEIVCSSDVPSAIVSVK